MMTLSTMVSQPVWLLVTLIGVADILILAWCITLIRRNRNPSDLVGTQDDFVTIPEQPLPVGQFQQNLTCMQIDAVFDSLTALIETERVKLKTMIHPSVAQVRTASTYPRETPDEKLDVTVKQSRSPMPEPPLDQQIVNIADSGMKPATIADRLGISLAEVNLALRLRTGATSMAGCKLEAVA